MSVRKFRYLSQLHDGVPNVEVIAGWDHAHSELYLRVYRILPGGASLECIWDSDGLAMTHESLVGVAFGFTKKLPRGWVDAVKADAEGRPTVFEVTSYRMEQT